MQRKERGNGEDAATVLTVFLREMRQKAEGRSKPESTLESGSTKYRKSRGVVTFVTNCDKTVTKCDQRTAFPDSMSHF